MKTENNSLATISFPVYFSNEVEMPLGVYGCEILKKMPKNNPEKYWQLSFSGNLMSTIKEKENELEEMKYIISGEMEKKFPRPKTDNFLEIANHMQQIDELAERVVMHRARLPF